MLPGARRRACNNADGETDVFAVASAVLHTVPTYRGAYGHECCCTARMLQRGVVLQRH